MNQFGDLYSQYYDLLYHDKDYRCEAEYIDGLIKVNCMAAKTILDIGCGTGKHAEIFCDKGYIVHGIDLSKEMLDVAETRRKGKEDKLSFSYSSIYDLNLDKKFDVVVSLFHVMSYQNSNDALIKSFEVAKAHLNVGGLFIFDFWYGPAVLNDLPSVRVKRLENHEIKFTRVAEPFILIDENVVEVKYTILIEEKATSKLSEVRELHRMRYFFDPELNDVCNNAGFSVEAKYEWLSHVAPGLASWYAVWVIKSA